MLDLVKQETERIDSRFLEPACGTGNFLAEILERKLRVVKERYRKSQFEYELNAIFAVSTLYGIDILEDNVVECRRRLFDLFNQRYTGLFKAGVKEECRNSVRYILSRNIIWGDALTLKTVGENSQPIVFPQWSPINSRMFKRQDFAFHALLPYKKEERYQLTLFSEPEQLLISDLGEEAFIPSPVKDYPPIHFLRIADEE